MTLDLPHGFKRWSTFAEVEAGAHRLGEEWRGQQAFQAQLLANGRERKVGGYCALCQCETEFAIRGPEDAEPNWRETLNCRQCELINRWRASAHLYRLLATTAPAGLVYMTEQTTPLFAWMAERYPGLIGSEYLGPDVAPGATVSRHGMPLRHEDITALSMASGSLGAILTFDVLEHVPDYRAAVREFARALMPGGLLLLTAPFHFQGAKTIVRARLGDEGRVEHLLPPMYHGDPLSADGVLCWQEFGWDLLTELRDAGFGQTEVISCWAPEFGYLGGLQPFVVGRR
jgi:SAM-dependent methyltransferase